MAREDITLLISAVVMIIALITLITNRSRYSSAAEVQSAAQNAKVIVQLDTMQSVLDDIRLDNKAMRQVMNDTVVKSTSMQNQIDDMAKRMDKIENRMEERKS